jgi:hypothetical protein
MATMLVAPKPFYEIQGDMAQSEQQQQAVEMNKIKIEQAKQDMATEQARKLDMQRAYQMSQGQQPDTQTQTQAQPDITQLARQQNKPTIDSQKAVQPTEVKAPDGTPMPSFMGGAGKEAEAKAPAVDSNSPEGYKQQPETKTDPATGEPTIIQKMTETRKAASGIDQAISINNNAIKLAYQRGDAAYAKYLLDENNDLKIKQADAQIKALTASQKGLEVMGQLGNTYKGGYNQFLKDNPNATPEQKQAMSDSLWAEVILKAQNAGGTGQDLYKYVTPDQRNQYAEGLINGSEKGSDMARIKIAEANNAAKIQIADQRNNISQQKIALDTQYKTWQMNNGDIKTGASIIEGKRKILETEIKAERQAAMFGDEKAQDKINAAEAQLELLKRDEAELGKKQGGTKAIADAKADIAKHDSAPSKDTTAISKLKGQALDAIKKGEDPARVKAAYKQMTGEDLESTDTKGESPAAPEAKPAAEDKPTIDTPAQEAKVPGWQRAYQTATDSYLKKELQRIKGNPQYSEEEDYIKRLLKAREAAKSADIPGAR